MQTDRQIGRQVLWPVVDGPEHHFPRCRTGDSGAGRAAVTTLPLFLCYPDNTYMWCDLQTTDSVQLFLRACLHLDHEQPLLLFSVALQETVLSSLQSLSGIIQAGQSLQKSITPHNIQLKDSKVVHRAEQRRAAFTATNHRQQVNTVPHAARGGGSHQPPAISQDD